MLKKRMAKMITAAIGVLVITFMAIQNVYAYQFTGYVITYPSSIGIYCNNAYYENMFYTYAKKWSQCSELYLYETGSFSAQIKASISGSSTGNYAVTYSYGNNDHSIVFYAAWQSADDLIKQETVVHEVGHALGLAHTQSAYESISVMRATGFNGKPYPLSDDIAGISYLY